MKTMPDNEKNRVFRVYPFLDLRTLRKLYLKNKKGMVELDSADNPSPEKAEVDFGLRRSTTHDALAFLRQCVIVDDPDDLTEFLDDK